MIAKCIEIKGPDIFNFDSFPDPKCAIIDDHIGNDESRKGFQILNSLIDCQPDIQTFIEYAVSDDCPRATSIPWYFIQQSQLLSQYTKQNSLPVKTETFGFMCNKLRLSRQMMIDLLSLHQLNTNTYTLVSDRWVAFPPQYFEHEESQKLDGCIKNKGYDNITMYDQFMRESLFEPTYIHLITEPGWLENSTFFTEKTVFPLDAGCIPIWVGGWKQPSWMREQGFDVFDDIVDHSYEDLDDPEQRIKQAILRNKDLLKNIELAADFYKNNQSRFKHNQELLRSDKIYKKYLNQINNLDLDKQYKNHLLNWIKPHKSLIRSTT